MNEIAAELAIWLAAGDRVAIATVVRVTGSAPAMGGRTSPRARIPPIQANLT